VITPPILFGEKFHTSITISGYCITYVILG